MLMLLLAEPEVNYTISLSASPSQGGTTTPSEGTHTYNAGTEVTVTAHPNPGWRFVNWTGPVANPNSAVTTVTMNGDRTVTANFVVDDVRPVHNITQGTFYHTIQEGIDASHPGNVIVVSSGTYQENIVLDGKSITLRSSDPENPSVVASTVIDGGGSDVVKFQGGDESTLQGFTIRNGDIGIMVHGSTAIITDNTITGNEESGIRIYSATAEITDNTIEGNGEHGIEIGLGATATITDNTIEGNGEHGIMVISFARAEITKNTIIGNERGIGISHSSTATITNNEITGNEMDGIAVSGGEDPGGESTATITDNRITGNGWNGIAVHDSEVTITHNRITGNDFIGIVLSFSADATINNNEITGNVLNGIHVVNSSTADIRDNTITGNEFLGIGISHSSTATIINNRIEENREFGISVLWSSTADIRDNTITRNEESGIVIIFATATITGNTINHHYDGGVVGSEFLPGWPHAVPCWTCFAGPCPSIPDYDECDPEDLIFYAPAGTFTFNGNTFLGNTIDGEYDEGAHIR